MYLHVCVYVYRVFFLDSEFLFGCRENRDGKYDKGGVYGSYCLVLIVLKMWNSSETDFTLLNEFHDDLDFYGISFSLFLWQENRISMAKF